MANSGDTILSGTNAAFIAEMYAKFLDDPGSVDSGWSAFFADLDEDGTAVLAELKGASWAPSTTGVIGRGNGEVRDTAEGKTTGQAAGLAPDQVRAAAYDSIRARMLIRAYRVRGHLGASFDPLGLEGKGYHSELDYKTYGFADGDLDRSIYIDSLAGVAQATLREILAILQRTYCGSIGVEYMHIQTPEEKAWIIERIEGAGNQTQFTNEGKRAILERLIEAEEFERYLHVKHTGTKRFGLEGGESLIPALEQILKRGGQLGVKEVVIGMPHRGRLNVLANFMHKPYRAIFSEFQGIAANPDDVQGSGDVKYHLGTSADRVFDDNEIHLSLTANPSHLEAVNPVVQGKVRAKQRLAGGYPHRLEVLGLLMHGDAAFAGQGLVPECLGLSELHGYGTAGTIHVIVNNQIGFTTNPKYSRSSSYPSDIAKGIQAPIFHVNGDDPEAVVHVARIATEFRQEFKRDVVIDMFCYRRHGHNEGDEPGFTQPIMYRAITDHPTTREIYSQRLAAEGVVGEEESQAMIAAFHQRLDVDFEAAGAFRPNEADWLGGTWSNLIQGIGDEELHEDATDVPMKLLKEVGRAISAHPEDFELNPKIARQLDAKRKMIDSAEGLDWSTAEALAFGTLACEGTHVRLSGQDSGRGTFSQRHSVLVDQNDETRYLPLNNIREDQAEYEVVDSPLSEAAVLGFEYGYSLADPNSLVLWEAQFGDFANMAQGIIDQFISAGESKWLRMTGLVMLLPHGYEGQGPEHSSARLERYLQQCAEYNMQVVNCTTPANYFHVLRRQVRRNYRKPLIIMTPKSLLRHKLAVSTLKEMGPKTRFQRVLPETDKLIADAQVRRVVLCAGKIYYDLLQARRDDAIDDIAIVRIEQLYPWPTRRLSRELQRYPNAEIVWCQEEPQNMGAWNFVDRPIERVLGSIDHGAGRPVYIGRPASASTAAGSIKVHQAELAVLIAEALGGSRRQKKAAKKTTKKSPKKTAGKSKKR